MSLTVTVLAAEPNYQFAAHGQTVSCSHPNFSITFDAHPDRVIYTDRHNPHGIGFATHTADGILHVRIEPLLGESHYRPHGLTWPTYDRLIAHRITAATHLLG